MLSPDSSHRPATPQTWSDQCSWSTSLSGLLDCFPNAQVGPAAADVAGHRIVDLGIGGMRIAGNKRGGRHDLAGLAVAALWNFVVQPGLLDLRARGRCPDGFDGRDLRI